MTTDQKMLHVLRSLLKFFIIYPERVGSYFLWVGPLFARVIAGYIFMLTGWYKLNHLPDMIDAFRGWGIPYPEILTPIASGIECFGGALLIAGLFTRIAGGMLAVVMGVAVLSAKLSDIDSVETLFGFEETAYAAIFLWLAVCGAGKASLDYLLTKKVFLV